MQSSTVLRDACMTISYADVRSPSRNSNTRTTNWPSNMHVLPKPRQNDSRDLSIESLYTHASVAGSRFSKRLHEFFPAAVMSFFVQLETPTHAIIYFYFRTLRFCVFVSLRDVRGCKDRLFCGLTQRLPGFGSWRCSGCFSCRSFLHDDFAVEASLRGWDITTLQLR